MRGRDSGATSRSLQASARFRPPVPRTGSAVGRWRFVDATGIGIRTAVLGIPPAVPLAALVFLDAFIPIIVAVVAGGVAVVIALVAAARSRRW